MGGHKAAATSAAVTSVSGQEAAESFVLMVANGGSVSRRQVGVEGKGERVRWGKVGAGGVRVRRCEGAKARVWGGEGVRVCEGV